MANPVNLLILDEPTNHLDLPSCDHLENALNAYPGTLILVTHDRYLIRSVADSLIVVRNGTATWHDGLDEDLLKPPQLAPGVGKSAAASGSPHRRERDARKDEARHRSKLSEATRELRKARDEVELAWEKAENELADIQRQLADSATYDDPKRVATLTQQHDRLKDQAAQLMEEYDAVVRRIGRKEAELD